MMESSLTQRPSCRLEVAGSRDEVTMKFSTSQSSSVLAVKQGQRTRPGDPDGIGRQTIHPLDIGVTKLPGTSLQVIGTCTAGLYFANTGGRRPLFGTIEGKKSVI